MKSFKRNHYIISSLLFISAIVATLFSFILNAEEGLYLQLSVLPLTCFGLHIMARISHKKQLGRYAPWNENFKQASAWFAMAIMSEWMAFTYGYTLISLIAAITLVTLGKKEINQGQKRIFGLMVEKRAVKTAKKIFKGCRIRDNFNFPGVGNIDMVIMDRFGLKNPYVVEIKSWHGLRANAYGLVKMNGQMPYGSPIDQVKRQAEMIKKSKPVIWLPNARQEKYFYFRGVLIVNGDADYFYKILKSL